jgi:hypothetical protein
MDPTSLLLVAVTYAAAQVARKMTDDAAAALWGAVKAGWRKTFSTEPQAATVTAESVDEVSVNAPRGRRRARASHAELSSASSPAASPRRHGWIPIALDR